jgi:thioredoxin 1
MGILELVQEAERCGGDGEHMSSALDITEQSWDAEVIGSDTPVIVDFWAPWCGPCKMVAPELDKLAGRVGGAAKFVKLNIDESRDIAVKYGIMSIPTIAKFEHGEITAQVVGARSSDALGRELGLES